MSGKLLISDANILIDIIVGGIVERMFKLEYDFGVPDVLFRDELQEQYPILPDQGLKVLMLEADAIADTVDILAKHVKTGVSSNDCMALALARQEQCPLLTGDWVLRQIALSERIDVRGTLWLIEEMFNAKLINLQLVRKAYAAMKTDGRRLPWNEVDEQLKRFANR